LSHREGPKTRRITRQPPSGFRRTRI
jgi:hypothetical protein